MSDDYVEPSYLEWAIMSYLRQNKANFGQLVALVYRVPQYRLFEDEVTAFHQALERLQQRRWIAYHPVMDLYRIIGQV